MSKHSLVNIVTHVTQKDKDFHQLSALKAFQNHQPFSQNNDYQNHVVFFMSAGML